MYRGHVFWDTEIFTLPLFTFTQPETARSLLLFRYNTLQASRLNAQQEGYTFMLFFFIIANPNFIKTQKKTKSGAKIAWEAADTGSEECPKWTMDLVCINLSIFKLFDYIFTQKNLVFEIKRWKEFGLVKKVRGLFNSFFSIMNFY